MDAQRLRRLHRETQTDLVIADKRRHVVISPTVTRRPALDAMLGTTSMVAQHELELLLSKIHEGKTLDRDDRKAFKELTEMLLKQTRLEMEVEKHVEQRMGSSDDKDLAELIRREVHDCLSSHTSTDVASSLAERLISALELDPHG